MKKSQHKINDIIIVYAYQYYDAFTIRTEISLIKDYKYKCKAKIIDITKYVGTNHAQTIVKIGDIRQIVNTKIYVEIIEILDDRTKIKINNDNIS